MQKIISALDNFHKTRIGYAVFAVIELALAYLFISWAINDGSIFDYLFTLLFTVGALQNVIKLIGSYFHGNSARPASR